MNRSTRLPLTHSALVLLALTAPLAQSEQVSLPEAKYLTLPEIRQGLAQPRLRVEAFPLNCLYHRLQIPNRFAWYCDRFGEASVTKLRSFFKVAENKVSPTFIEIDLDDGVLFYRPVGAVGSDLTKSDEWGGKELEGAANALNHAKSHSFAIVEARKRYYANNATWAQTLAFSKELEQSGHATPAEEWSIRGMLFSPKSEPEIQLTLVEKDDLALANYGKKIKAECSISQTISGRIVDIPDLTEMIFISDSGLRVSYHAFETAIDVDRKPVDAKALLSVADKSKKGILADVRYVEMEGQRIILTCQLRGVTAPLINEMAWNWDGTDTMALEIVQRVEEETGRSAVTPPRKRVVRSMAGVTTPDATARIWLQSSVGGWR
jgi:hypothetical protein